MRYWMLLTVTGATLAFGYAYGPNIYDHVKSGDKNLRKDEAAVLISPTVAPKKPPTQHLVDQSHQWLPGAPSPSVTSNVSQDLGSKSLDVIQRGYTPTRDVSPSQGTAQQPALPSQHSAMKGRNTTKSGKKALVSAPKQNKVGASAKKKNPSGVKPTTTTRKANRARNHMITTSPEPKHTPKLAWNAKKKTPSERPGGCYLPPVKNASHHKR